MISIDKAVEFIRDNITDRKTESISFENSLGFVLAEEIVANDCSPRFDNSGMDGFAVKWEDVKDCSESNLPELNIVGESRAGIPFQGAINNGEAIRISTGAMVHEDADTVLPIEEVEDRGDTLLINMVVKKGKHVRYKAEEIKVGDIIINKDNKISPGDVALMASFGVNEVQVYSKPKIAVIVTGSEFASDDKIEPWQIRNSNSFMLKSAITSSGADCVYYEQVSDSMQNTIDAIAKATELADIVILSGGVSVGPHDHVKTASVECGFKEIFWKINQKPGKPLYFAKKDETLLFGLPGNPVSALSTYAFYIHPIISYLKGQEFKSNKHPYTYDGVYKNKGSRDQFVRVNKDGKYVKAVELQGSHMLSSISSAYGFMIVKCYGTIEDGEKVMVYYYPWSV